MHPKLSCHALQAIGDVVIGSVLPLSGQRANECRIAMFLAGFPDTVPVHTVNRFARLQLRFVGACRTRQPWPQQAQSQGCSSVCMAPCLDSEMHQLHSPAQAAADLKRRLFTHLLQAVFLRAAGHRERGRSHQEWVLHSRPGWGRGDHDS